MINSKLRGKTQLSSHLPSCHPKNIFTWVCMVLEYLTVSKKQKLLLTVKYSKTIQTQVKIFLGWQLGKWDDNWGLPRATIGGLVLIILIADYCLLITTYYLLRLLITDCRITDYCLTADYGYWWLMPDYWSLMSTHCCLFITDHYWLITCDLAVGYYWLLFHRVQEKLILLL